MNQNKNRRRSLVNKESKQSKNKIVEDGLLYLDEYKDSHFSQGTKSILIVDEDEDTRNNVMRVFSENAEFISVHTAKNVMDFAKVIENSELDLMIIDSKLSWVDGFELCTLLREQRRFKTIPIILFLEHSLEEEIKKGFDLGANAYMIKPIDSKELQVKVENLLAKS